MNHLNEAIKTEKAVAEPLLDGKLASEVKNKWVAPVWQHCFFAGGIKSDLLQLSRQRDDVSDEAGGALPEGVMKLLEELPEDKEHVICMSCFDIKDKPLKDCICACSKRLGGTFKTANLGTGHLNKCIGDNWITKTEDQKKKAEEEKAAKDSMKTYFHINAKKGDCKAKSYEDALLLCQGHLVKIIKDSSPPDSGCEDKKLRELLHFCITKADLLKPVSNQLHMGRHLLSATRKHQFLVMTLKFNNFVMARNKKHEDPFKQAVKFVLISQDHWDARKECFGVSIHLVGYTNLESAEKDGFCVHQIGPSLVEVRGHGGKSTAKQTLDLLKSRFDIEQNMILGAVHYASFDE
jgi:hypothetical protein